MNHRNGCRSRALTLLLLLVFAARAADWPANVIATRAGEFSHAGRTYASSSSLRAAWSAPGVPVDHYLVFAAEKRSTVRAEALAAARELVISGLKASTEYNLAVRACLDRDCATADRLVPDGNVGSYAFRYGPWAGPALDGRIQLYYTPLQREEKGIKIGEMIAPVADSLNALPPFAAFRATA